MLKALLEFILVHFVLVLTQIPECRAQSAYLAIILERNKEASELRIGIGRNRLGLARKFPYCALENPRTT